MPRRKRNGLDDGSEDDADAETQRDRTVKSSSPNIAMTEDMLQTLVSTITRSQAESNRVLIESILAGNRDQLPSTPSPRPDTQGHSLRSGNFSKCTTRFDASSKNADELEAFIDSIEVYRDCTNVSDEHALRGLPMLLTGEAAVWWQGVKSSVTSWTDALQRLRGMYGVPRPAYKIFRDIFATEQSSERADVFISKVRALLAKLPYIVPEGMKLDIVYGLLDRRIRKRVSRDAVDGLEQLITKVRGIAKPTVTSSSDLRTPSAKRSDSEGQLNRVRPKCIYCKLFGHTVDNCRNKEKKDSSKVDDSANRSSNSQLRCYGCGQLGVIRSKCQNCKSAPTTSKSDFCSAYVYDKDESRPLVEVQVVNRTGVAILDTGATHSIAGPMLYGLLVDAGVEFRKTSRTIGLADGSQQVCAALECDTDVTLEGHVIPTTFLVLPNAPTRTLLGRDFIMKALILLDLPQSSWCFNDEPRCWYPFITSFDLPTTGEMELMKVEASNLVLRDEEGAKLTADQRTELNALL
ncbi:Retrovirus-related Pol polyprotein from transposon 17.6, partial [Operophtera brumata]